MTSTSPTTATVADLLTDSYLLTGILGGSQTLTPYQSTRGLRALNVLIDSWNANNIELYTIEQLIISVDSVQQSYTFGPGGDFNVPFRPPQIERMFFRQLTTSPFNDIPMTQLSAADWGNIRSKGIQGNIATYYYYDANFPTATVNIWPIPASAGNGDLYVQCYQQLNSNLKLTDLINLPPAYYGALQYNLAIMLNNQAGFDTLAQVLALAGTFKKSLERNNGQILQRMSYDATAMGGTCGRYMVTSDSIRVN